jgi:hypothetical protein
MPDFPKRGVAIAQALLAQQPNALPGDDDHSRVFIKRVAEQMAYELGPAYGVKSAGPGRPQGPSQIAYTGDAQFGGWRLIDGGTRILDNPPWQAFPGQLFLPVDPVDHLHMRDQQPPPRSDPPPSPVDLSPILARLATLEQTVNALASQLPVVASEADEALHRPYPRYVAKFWGITIVSVPEGS